MILSLGLRLVQTSSTFLPIVDLAAHPKSLCVSLARAPCGQTEEFKALIP